MHGPKSQTAYRQTMNEPRSITLTRAEMEMVVALVIKARDTYWNNGKPFPGYKAADEIINKMTQQVIDCVPISHESID